jgi:hypothetical protein
VLLVTRSKEGGLGWLILAASVELTLAFAGTYAVAIVLGLGPCGGDGGMPYAAPGSPQGRLCHGPVALLAIYGAPLAALAGGFAAMSLRRGWPLLVNIPVAVLLALVPLNVVLSASPE